MYRRALILFFVLLPPLASWSSMAAKSDVVSPQNDDDGTCRSMRQTKCYNWEEDPRDCAFPLCGGLWLRSTRGNERLIKCADGSKAKQCYVADVNKRCLLEEDKDPLPKIICGSYVDGKYEGFPEIAKLKLKRKQCFDLRRRSKCYKYRLDTNRCMFPLCGGYWLQRKSGNKEIKCPNGTKAKECYVGALDTSCLPKGSSEEPGDTGVVCGRYVDGDYDAYPEISNLVVKRIRPDET